MTNPSLGDLPDLGSLDPARFESVALDALRAHVAQEPSWMREIAERLGCSPSEEWVVRAYRTPFGKTDGGYDGEVLGLGEGAARIAVEAKRADTADKVQRAVKEYVARKDRHDRPVVFLTAADLSKPEVETIEKVGRLAVVGAGEIASWLRAHPYVARSHALVGGHPLVRSLAAYALDLASSPMTESLRDQGPSDPCFQANLRDRLLTTEREAVDAILGSLPAPGEALIVSYAPGVVADRIRAAVSQGLLSEGMGGGASTLCVREGDAPVDPAAWEEAIGAPPRRARLWIPSANARSLDGLLRAVKNPGALGWWIEVSPGQEGATEVA